MKFFIKNFFSKCDQIRRKLRIWSHLPKKSLMKNFILCAVFHLAEIHIRYRKMKNNHRATFLMLATHIVIRILYATLQVWDHPFSTRTKFSEKLTFLILSYVHVRNTTFPEIFANVLNR